MDDPLASEGPRTGHDDNDSTITEAGEPNKPFTQPEPPPDVKNLTPEDAVKVLSKVQVKHWFQAIRTADAEIRGTIAKLLCQNIRGFCIGDDYLQIMFHEDPPFCQSQFRYDQSGLENFFGDNSPHRILENCAPGGFCRTEIQNATSDFPSHYTLPLSPETLGLCMNLVRNAGPRFELLHFGQTKSKSIHMNFTCTLLVRVNRYCTNLKSLVFDRYIFDDNREDLVTNIFTEALPRLTKLEEFVALNGFHEAQMRDDHGSSVHQMVESILVPIVKPIRKLILDNIWMDDDVVRHLNRMTLQSLCFRSSDDDPLMTSKLLDPPLLSSRRILADLRLSFRLLPDSCFPEALSAISRFLNLRSFSFGYQHATEECVDAGPIAKALSTGFSNLKSLQVESIDYGQLVNAEFSPNGHFLDNVSRHLVYLSFMLRGDLEDGGFLRNCGDLRLVISPHLTMWVLKTLVVYGAELHPKCHIADFIADHCPMLSLLFCYDVGTQEWTPQLNALYDRLHICNDAVNRPKKKAPSGNFAPSLAVQRLRINTSESPSQLATSNRCGKVFRESTRLGTLFVVDIDRICGKTN